MSKVERDLAVYYDNEATDRAARALLPQRVDARTEFISALAQSDRTVLEIGVGAGQDAAAFVDSGRTVVGVDLSAVFAGMAYTGGASTAVATVRTLPLRDLCVDVVWSMSVLMHVPRTSIDDALDEIRRVLRPGGVAAIGVWGGEDRDTLLPGRFGPPRLFSRHSDEHWRELLSRIGTVERFETWDDTGDPFWYQFAVTRRA